MKDTLISLLKEFYIDFTQKVDIETQDYIWSVLECEIYFVNKIDHIRSSYREGQEFPDYKFLIAGFCNKNEFLNYVDEFASDIIRASMGKDLETIFISDRLPNGDIDSYYWET